MLSIRRSVFETNSSSAHSIVVLKKDEHYTPDEIEYGVWCRSGKWIMSDNDLNFGRSPFEILDTFERKAQFALASINTECYGREKEYLERYVEWICVLQDCGIKIDSVEFPKEYWSEHENRGNIDHQSAGLFLTFLTHSGISLKEFLTNKKYIVIIDGDEYQIWNDMKRDGLVNTGVIECEYGGIGGLYDD